MSNIVTKKCKEWNNKLNHELRKEKRIWAVPVAAVSVVLGLAAFMFAIKAAAALAVGKLIADAFVLLISCVGIQKASIIGVKPNIATRVSTAGKNVGAASSDAFQRTRVNAGKAALGLTNGFNKAVTAASWLGRRRN
jgi:hypothetical protein